MAAYDHVVLCQLWGDMRALPRAIPRFTHELRQRWEDAGSPPLPAAPARPARRAGRRPAQPRAVAGAGSACDARLGSDDRERPSDRPSARVRHAHRSADRRRRLPGTQRGDPGRRPQGRRRLRPRVRRLPRRLAGPLEDIDHAARASPRCAASCRAAAPSSARRAPTRSSIDGGVDADHRQPARARRRRADRDRRRGHPRRRDQAARAAASTSSACRRRSTTTSTPPTTPSASTPRSTSRWRPSTGCTPRPSRTTAR